MPLVPAELIGAAHTHALLLCSLRSITFHEPEPAALISRLILSL
jgi:hypothetical protein